MIEQAYRGAQEGVGTAYLEAERRLREAGPDALPFLRGRVEEEETGPAALVARALLERVAGNEALAGALADLERMARKAAHSVAGELQPAFVYGWLKKHYGPAAAPLLAGYLLKLWEVWPGWMTAGVAMYVGEQGGPEVSDALLPLALQTPDPYQREVAARALALTGDPAVPAKLEALVAEAPEDARPALHAAAEDVRRRVDAFG